MPRRPAIRRLPWLPPGARVIAHRGALVYGNTRDTSAE
jgi:hypothetical protein